MILRTLYWKNKKLYLLDQRLLPARARYIACATHGQAARAIKDMAVRGAPAIGIAAAFGIALAARERTFRSPDGVRAFVGSAARTLAATRPTAVNLFWALKKMKEIAATPARSPAEIAGRLEKEALHLYRRDIAANRRIGTNGAALLKKGSIILTHCNAGALATAGYGTALGVIRAAFRQRKVAMVYVDETRPYLQGSRLTAWELSQEKIPHVLITDSMAGHFMKTGGITAVVVGADRIASNGDTANKIGTYSLAVLAHHHRIPFYVAAPFSTIDATIRSGKEIVIEERSSEEILYFNRRRIAPEKTAAKHPAFDVTPARFITAVVTEKGTIKPAALAKALCR